MNGRRLRQGMTMSVGIASRRGERKPRSGIQSPLPPDLVRLGTTLLHQQLWCWGCDIRRGEGNLLCRDGFERHRPPRGTSGSSAYLRRLTGGRSVILWGFGVFYGEADLGGLFLKRYGFSPRLAPASEVELPCWSPDQIPALHRPVSAEEWRRAGTLLIRALWFIEEYERWVLQVAGPGYREHCVGKWEDRVVSGVDMARAWGDLALRCAVALGVGAGTTLRPAPSSSLDGPVSADVREPQG